MARTRLDVRFSSGGFPPVHPNVLPAARLPAPLSLVAGRVGRARDRLAGRRGRDRVPDGRRARERRQLAGPARALDDRHRGPARRARAGALHGRPPLHLRPPGARSRVRHAQRSLREPAAPLVRLLRPPPDRPADVARDGRPPVGALLPRLRPHLLLPARPHDRGRVGRALHRRLAARARRDGLHAGARLPRVPLLQRLAPGSARRPAEDGRRRDRRRGEHRRRPRRQVLRAGAERDREVRRSGRRASSAARSTRTASGRSTCPCSRSCRCSRRRPSSCSAAAWSRTARSGSISSSRSTSRAHARDAASDARHVDRPGAARDRVGRADLRGDRRARGRHRRAGRARPPAGRRAHRVRARGLRLHAGPAGARRDRPRGRAGRERSRSSATRARARRR